MSEFVSEAVLRQFTGKERSSAQARFLNARNMKFIPRDDGSIALRQDELDRHTLTVVPKVKPRRRVDLSYLDKAG